MVTAYISEDLPVVAPYVQKFKISSFEASDAVFLRAVMAYGRPILVSTGMHSHGDVKYLFDMLSSHQSAVTLLQCTSAYPCPPSAANLRMLLGVQELRAYVRSFGRTWERGDIHWGFSDHTRSPLAGAVAVGAGASVVEFHLRLDGTDPGNPDFAVSRSPEEARIYVENIRQAEVLMGDGEKRVMPEEAPMVAYKRQG